MLDDGGIRRDRALNCDLTQLIVGLLGEVIDDAPELLEDLRLPQGEFRGPGGVIEGDDHILDLVAPEKLVALAILETSPGMEELGDAMVADVVGVLGRLLPGERGANVEQTHASYARWRERRDGEYEADEAWSLYSEHSRELGMTNQASPGVLAEERTGSAAR